MNLPLATVFYAVVSVAAVWLVFLWLAAQLQAGRRRRALKILFGIVTVLLLFVPLGGPPLWNRAFSFYPNPSFPMLGMVCAGLWYRLFRIRVLKPADWSATWIFGAAAGSALYLHSLLGGLDLYYWGWDREMSAWMLAGAATLCLGRGNRLGVLLLAAAIGYAVNALESLNAWDYVIDPFYWLISLGVLGVRGVGALIARFRQPRASGRAAPETETGSVPAEPETVLALPAISSAAPAVER